MSQITKLFEGTPAPSAETLTGDIGGPINPDGALNISLLTGDGLTSTGVPATHTITFTLDGLTKGTGQTIGAVTADVITLNLGATPTTYIIEAKVAAFESTTPAGSGYNLICAAITTGAAASVVGIEDKYVAEDAAIVGGDANFVAVGNTIILRVTGVAALTLNWVATTSSLAV